MSTPPLVGRYIICGAAWYRVTHEDAERVYCTVAAGSARVLDRAVIWHRSELRAMHALGECRIRDGPVPSGLTRRDGLEELDASKTHTADGKRR